MFSSRVDVLSIALSSRDEALSTAQSSRADLGIGLPCPRRANLTCVTLRPSCHCGPKQRECVNTIPDVGHKSIKGYPEVGRLHRRSVNLWPKGSNKLLQGVQWLHSINGILQETSRRPSLSYLDSAGITSFSTLARLWNPQSLMRHERESYRKKYKKDSQLELCILFFVGSLFMTLKNNILCRMFFSNLRINSTDLAIPYQIRL